MTGRRLARFGAAVLILAAVATAVVLATRAYPIGSEEAPAASDAGRVEKVTGSTVPRVVLTEEAAKRIDIRTAQVQAAHVAGRPHLTLPYAAVLYDESGATWTYTNPEPLVFVRHPLTVVTIQGEVATVSHGPPAGTAVVTVGATELYGTEVGVGK
jgi:hypothetical protein